MRTSKNEALDSMTKKAWQMNWQDIDMSNIMQIFEYDRVKKQMELITRFLPKDQKILEGGCGLCPYVIQLDRLGYDVEGVDYNAEPLAKAREYVPGLRLQVADVAKLPFQDETFGGYFSNGVIEHFTEGPERAILEAARVLKKGGVFLAAVPRRHLFMILNAPVRWLKKNAWIRKLFGKAPPDQYYWEQYFTKADLTRILEKCGFEVQGIYPQDHSHSLVSFSNLFRDKSKFDEANELGLKLGRFFEKYFPWSTAAQMTFVCIKK